MRYFVWVFILCVISVTFFAVPAAADAIYSYSYTGDTFTFAQGVYSPGNRVTGTFVLSDSFISNGGVGIRDISSFVMSYSFTDGHQTLTQSNSLGVFDFGFNPDGTPVLPTDGGPLNTSWYVSLQTPTSQVLTEDLSGDYQTYAAMGTSAADILSIKKSLYPGGPGTWALQRVPEPGILLLLGMGIACGAAFELSRRRLPAGPESRG